MESSILLKLDTELEIDPLSIHFNLLNHDVRRSVIVNHILDAVADVERQFLQQFHKSAEYMMCTNSVRSYIISGLNAKITHNRAKLNELHDSGDIDDDEYQERIDMLPDEIPSYIAELTLPSGLKIKTGCKIEDQNVSLFAKQ